MGKEKTGPEITDSTSLEIKSILQRYDYDCGQACLCMLGFDAYKLFPKKKQGLSTSDLFTIPQAIELSSHDEDVKTYDYSFPILLIFTGKGPIDGLTHWVIRYKNWVFCPGAGKVKAATYFDQFVDHVFHYFAIPSPHGPPIPEELRGKEKQADNPDPVEVLGRWNELSQSLVIAEKTEGATPRHPLHAKTNEALRDLIIRGFSLPCMGQESEAYIEYQGTIFYLYIDESLGAVAEEHTFTPNEPLQNSLREIVNSLPKSILEKLKNSL